MKRHYAIIITSDADSIKFAAIAASRIGLIVIEQESNTENCASFLIAPSGVDPGSGDDWEYTKRIERFKEWLRNSHCYEWAEIVYGDAVNTALINDSKWG